MEIQAQQTPVPPSAHWLRIVLFILLELIIIAGSVFSGIQIEKIRTQKTFQRNDLVMPATPSLQASPMSTISIISVCNTLSVTLFPTPKADDKQLCQVIELRVRDLLQTTYNAHHLLREIQNGQIQQTGLNKVNNLNNDLVDLWMNIAGYGLGTDPYTDIHIMVSSSASKDAKLAPNYGLPNQYKSIGIPRLYQQFIENSNLSSQNIQVKETKFMQLTQPYSNPAQYPFQDFFSRAYYSYRENKLLTSSQYKADLEIIDAWLTNLEKVLLQIPTFLNS